MKPRRNVGGSTRGAIQCVQWADRVQAGPDLEWRLEVALLDIDHPNGFAVRLHNLGDFYSVQYFELWHRLLGRHSSLHVWDTRHVSTEPIRLRRLLSRWYDANRIVLRFVSQTRQLRCSNYRRRFPLSILTKSPPTRSCARSRLARPRAVRHARFVGKAGAGLLSSNIDRGWLASGGGCGSRADHIHVQQSPEPRPEAWTDGRTPSSRGGFIDR